jgi:hypothetical protein
VLPGYLLDVTEPALRAGVSPGTGATASRAARGLTEVTDRLLDGSVVVLATWTVVYHLCLLLGLGSSRALLLEAVVLVVATLGRLSVRPVRPARPRPAAVESPTVESPTVESPTVESQSVESPAREPDPGAGSASWHPARWDRLTVVTMAAALVCAVAMTLNAPWPLVCATWLLAGATGTTYAVRRLRGATPPPGPPRPGTSAAEGWVACGCALGLAGFSTVVLRPNPDDLFYVNWAQWVAEHGEFPLRDTLYSDLDLPLANWPPIASYDGLAGALAHLFGTSAGTVLYEVVPPVATALAVLALWRLLRAWRVRHVTVALLAALVFLLVDGTSSYATPGNLFVTRMWQGKVILACVLVPVLLVHLLRYVEQPTRARLGWLFLCGAAAVGLSTTAMFLVPVVAAAGVAPMLRRRWRPAVPGFAATAVYPVAAGVATLALGGRSADDFGSRREYRFNPAWFGHQLFLDGPMALVVVLAVLLGTLLVVHPAARVTTGVAVLVVGVTFVPGATRLSYDAVGLGPTLWRLAWACSVAALVGAAASWLAGRLRNRRSVAAAGVGAALLVTFFGAPIWAKDTNTSLERPPHWQRGEQSTSAAGWLVRQAGPGDRVLAPDEMAISVVVEQTEVKVVAARDYYLDYLREEPGFHYSERLALAQFANGDPVTADADVPSALSLLQVRAVCLRRDDHQGSRLLREVGYERGYLSDTYRCFRR